MLNQIHQLLENIERNIPTNTNTPQPKAIWASEGSTVFFVPDQAEPTLFTAYMFELSMSFQSSWRTSSVELPMATGSGVFACY